MHLKLHKISKIFAKNGFDGKIRFMRILCESCEAIVAFTDQNEALTDALLLVIVQFNNS